MAGILVEDIFDVKDIDPSGKKFERGKEAWTNLKPQHLVIEIIFVL